MSYHRNLYNIVAWLVQIILPALAILLLIVPHIWGHSANLQVVLAVLILDLILGILLRRYSRKVTKDREGIMIGFIDVSKNEEGLTQMMLNFPGDPHEIEEHEKVTFKVRTET